MKRAALSLLIIIFVFVSCKLKDTESSNSVDPSGTTMTVDAPNGGESIEEGSSYSIEWTSDSEALINIHYTSDNGSTWTLVADSISNTGVYEWFPVPSVISTQCKVRVSSVDGVVADVSDAAFSITRSDNQSLTLKTPSGGEEWEAGTQKQIIWYSTGIDSVKLEYTTDNGNHWITIAVDNKNTGVYYWNPVPNTPSSLAKIRISDAYDSVPEVESEDTFYILPEPALSVTAPAGGESWASGSDQTIKWVSENISNVKIQYTTNGGDNWTTIVESTPSIGYYTWKDIPDLNSALCKIKIMDANDGQPYAVSSNNFTITNQVVKSMTVTSPNGGEEYESGTGQTIKWTATNVQYVNIELTVDGSTWTTIASNVASTGTYSWTVPTGNSALCRVRVSDATDSSVIDASDAVFTIAPEPSIVVTYPNGGESIRAGETVTIQWTSVGVEYVKIQYTTVNGVDDIYWNDLVPKAASSGSYEASFTVASAEYKIRVMEYENGSPRDESDGTFTVLPKSSISISTPNGGEHLLAGQTYELRWTSVNISKVKIEYTLDGEYSWNTAAVDIANTGSYLWTVPSITSSYSDLCKIRISEYDSSNPTQEGVSDMSDEVFSIHNGKFLRLVTPDGGEVFTIGEENRIEWISTGIEYVNIEYTVNGGVSWTTIVSNCSSTGAYMWTPPNTVSANALIRITDSSDSTIKDVSSSFFKLE